MLYRVLYRESGDIFDILEFTQKEKISFERQNPEFFLEEMDKENPLDIYDPSIFDDD